jgi:hypothetical protein
MLGSCCKGGDSQPEREAVNIKYEGSMALEAITRQLLLKTQETGKVLYVM